MWWTNQTSQIKKKKKDSWDPPQSFWFNPGSEAGVPYSAFLISKWGFHFENHGSVPEICGKTLYWQSKDSYSEEQRPGPLLFSNNDSLNKHPVLESVWETVFLNVYICCFDFVQGQNSKRMPVVMKTASAT